MARRDIWVAVLAVVLVPAALHGGEKKEKVEGYAEWRRGDCLIVDGQRVCPGPQMEFKGKDDAVNYESIPLGYEVKAEGVRDADGALIARKLEARTNGMAMFESDVLKGTNAAEAAYRRVGHMFEQVEEDKAVDFGVLHESGPQVERVRRIARRLLPPTVNPSDVRVYVVDNPEWNAMAMGNYSIYVFSGLLDDMDDDEVAIVLGHEIAHATHEHSRKQFKKQMWIQLAALGLGVVNEQIEDENANAIIALVGQFGASAWQNGYGRSHEDQADRVGLRYAYEAGFDIARGPQLWRRFAQKYGQESAVHNFFFSDHSLSTKRAAHLERELALNYPGGPKHASHRGPLPPVPAKALAPGSAPRDVRAGITTDEVLALLGQPEDRLAFGRRARWVYPDMTVVFEGGRVTGVRF